MNLLDGEIDNLKKDMVNSLDFEAFIEKSNKNLLTHLNLVNDVINKDNLNLITEEMSGLKDEMDKLK